MCELFMTIKQWGLWGKYCQEFIQISYSPVPKFKGVLKIGYTKNLMLSPWSLVEDWLRCHCMPDQPIAKLPKSEWGRIGIKHRTTHISTDYGNHKLLSVSDVCSPQDLTSYDKYIPTKYAEVERKCFPKNICGDFIQTDEEDSGI